MRSALYYPHTEIASEDVMKTALLLWDEIRAITPWSGYAPRYRDPLFQEAFEVIGKCHVPNEEEKLEAHGLIENLVAGNKLPPAFYFTPTSRWEAHGLHHMSYEVYSEKLMHKTWRMLADSGLAGERRGHDHPTSRNMGLTIMSILADCCAKDTYTRVTDRATAYASLQSLLADGLDAEAQTIKNELLPIAVRTVNPKRLSLKRLIAFRKKEGPAARDLRHRLLKHIDDQAEIVAKSKSKTEREEALRQYEEDTTDDFKMLKDALKLKTQEALGLRELLITIAGVAGMAASAGLDASSSMPEVATFAGGGVAIGGLIAAKSKFASERLKLLQEHPTAYIYEAAGGIRF